MFSATYSPEDNKLRLYASTRLDKELYERVRAAGFIWAPKQELFVAPMWTPGREDFLLGLCDEIGDEDTSLVERAEERAERFEDYHEARTEDAEAAQKAVHAIAHNIPMGQPILVGHHSERRARKDAERIENGMRKAVKMWDTAQYWKSRAAGAIAHAKYKELPAVRARRIKGIEADKRKQERQKADCEHLLKLWSAPGLTHEKALQIANLDRGSVTLANGEQYHGAWSALEYKKITAEEVQRQRLSDFPRWIARHDRWINHYNNRLEYERAMLAESGGIATDRKGPEVGGGCRCWASHRGGWSYIQKVNKVSVSVLDNWGNGGANFTRTIPFDKLSAVMTRAEVEAARTAGRLNDSADKTGFFLAAPETPEPSRFASEKREEAPQIEAMRDTLKSGGVQIAVAPQLFPTPAPIADRMVQLADLHDGQDVLEPSAGTGAIVEAIRRSSANQCKITAVEINLKLADALSLRNLCKIYRADFLECENNGGLFSQNSLGQFDRVLMNPPFEDASDIRHIEHAFSMLKPGGKLVAICANGPRQQRKFQPIADTWEELPRDTFAGTSVSSVLFTLTKEA